jgi:hypothetical protein
MAAEKAEQERIAAEKAEQARLATQKAEQERIAAEKAEQARLAAEKAEQERIAAEKAEQARLAAGKAEQERIAAENAEQARLAAGKAEQERITAQPNTMPELEPEPEPALPSTSVVKSEMPQAELHLTAASVSMGSISAPAVDTPAAVAPALAVGAGDAVQVFSASASCWLDGVVEQVDREAAEAEIRYTSAGADRLKWVSLRESKEVRAVEPAAGGSLSSASRGEADGNITGTVPLARAPLSKLPTASTVSMSPVRHRGSAGAVAAVTRTPTNHAPLSSPHTPVVGRNTTPGGKVDMGRAGLKKALAQLEIPNLAGVLASELGVQTLADMVHLETEDLADLAHHNVKAVQRRRLGRAIAFAKVRAEVPFDAAPCCCLAYLWSRACWNHILMTLCFVMYRTQQQKTLSQRLRSVQGRQVVATWMQLV